MNEMQTLRALTENKDALDTDVAVVSIGALRELYLGYDHASEKPAIEDVLNDVFTMVMDRQEKCKIEEQDIQSALVDVQKRGSLAHRDVLTVQSFVTILKGGHA